MEGRKKEDGVGWEGRGRKILVLWDSFGRSKKKADSRQREREKQRCTSVYQCHTLVHTHLTCIWVFMALQSYKRRLEVAMKWNLKPILPQ